MKRIIENGATIIYTEEAIKKTKNATGVVGLTYYKKQNRYRAEIKIKKKKFLIGFFATKSEAEKARKVADFKKANGTLDEFLKSKPHGNSAHFLDFWQACFDEYNL